MARVIDVANGRDLGEVTHPGLIAYYAGEGYEIDGQTLRGDDDAFRALAAGVAGTGQAQDTGSGDQPAQDGGFVQVPGDPSQVNPLQ